MGRRAQVVRPRPAPRVEVLPHALTFFLSGGERRRVVAALRRVHPDRAVALRRLVRWAVARGREKGEER